MTSLFGGYVADEASGTFVSEKHKTVATIINDYNPGLNLVWIPPAARTIEDAGHEFAIIHTNPTTGYQYVVMYAGADEVDERLLTRLWENDMTRHDVLSKLELMDMAAALIKQKSEEEAAAERQDIIATVVKSPLHTFKMENGRKINK